MNNELFEALNILEKEKNISKETLLEAIRQSLLQACKNHYGKNEVSNITPMHAEVHFDKQGVHSVESPYNKLDTLIGG